MKICRFVKLADNRCYTTANELGPYLASKGMLFKPHNDGYYHYGTHINRMLVEGLTQNNPTYTDNQFIVSYTFYDFPKLPLGMGDNDDIIKELLKLYMCVPSSVARMKKGSPEDGLDLYTKDAVKSLLKAYNISWNEEDFKEVETYYKLPAITMNKRVLTKSNSQKQLIPVQKGV